MSSGHWQTDTVTAHHYKLHVHRGMDCTIHQSPLTTVHYQSVLYIIIDRCATVLHPDTGTRVPIICHYIGPIKRVRTADRCSLPKHCLLVILTLSQSCPSSVSVSLSLSVSLSHTHTHSHTHAHSHARTHTHTHTHTLSGNESITSDYYT